MKLRNAEKMLILRLLEDEQFRILQHAQKLKSQEGTDLTTRAVLEAKTINSIISKLELRKRDKNEKKRNKT